jgi:hypothetical protein
MPKRKGKLRNDEYVTIEGRIRRNKKIDFFN